MWRQAWPSVARTWLSTICKSFQVCSEAFISSLEQQGPHQRLGQEFQEQAKLASEQLPLHIPRMKKQPGLCSSSPAFPDANVPNQGPRPFKDHTYNGWAWNCVFVVLVIPQLCPPQLSSAAWPGCHSAALATLVMGLENRALSTHGSFAKCPADALETCLYKGRMYYPLYFLQQNDTNTECLKTPSQERRESEVKHVASIQPEQSAQRTAEPGSIIQGQRGHPALLFPSGALVWEAPVADQGCIPLISSLEDTHGTFFFPAFVSFSAPVWHRLSTCKGKAHNDSYPHPISPPTNGGAKES